MAQGMKIAAASAALMLVGAAPVPVAGPVTVTPAPATAAPGRPLPMRIGGRVVRQGTMAQRQWPGTYWEGAFRGQQAMFRVGAGDVVLNVSVDGTRVARLVKPQPGLYAVAGLRRGRHVLRVDVASESQSAPTAFGGLYAAGSATPLPLSPRARRIEFIGDSHTVGYANTSTRRDCTDAEVWATTDTSQGIGGVLGRRYDAEYRVNAISGRGIVRNYDGFAGDTVPIAYPFALFDKGARADDAGWHPQLIVIALGTNDFSTQLRSGERWANRAALHADYESTYVGFVRRLRAAHPRAHILLWATDMAEGEIAAETQKVAERLRATGDRRVGFVKVPGLALSACHYHPSTDDDRRIADAVASYVEAHPGVWSGR